METIISIIFSSGYEQYIFNVFLWNKHLLKESIKGLIISFVITVIQVIMLSDITHENLQCKSPNLKGGFFILEEILKYFWLSTLPTLHP